MVGDKIKKRKYSRNGCKECKRRKLKCDEKKPSCWQCSHLGKECVYVKDIRFSESRSLTIKESPTEQHNSKPKSFNIVRFTPNQTKDSAFEENTSSSDEQEKADSSSKSDEKIEMMISEATNLANDLLAESDNLELEDFLKDLSNIESIKKQDILESFNLQEPHKSYLEIFYDKISSWIMPLEQGLCNEILIFHAKTAPYLLAAMLSLASKDLYKQRYVTTCLRNLNAVFQDTNNILNNIEPLILTVLLLAADSTSNSWRTHLRGAKDLFVKYIKLNTTPALLVAKSWFAAIEIIAGLQSFGTSKIEELDSLLDVGLYGDSSDYAIDMGLLLPNGYNVFLGYSTEAIIMYREFLKLQKLESLEFLFQTSLIHSAKEFQVASSAVIISKDNPMHPNYHDFAEKIILPTSCYGIRPDFVFSWFDLIHQLHVDAMLLKMLSDVLNLSSDHHLVQDVVKKMLEICYFMDSDGKVIDPSDTRLLMIHGPLFTCGLNCIDEQDKLRVVNYFNSLISLGINSPTQTFRIVQDKWNGTLHSSSANLSLVPFA